MLKERCYVVVRIYMPTKEVIGKTQTEILDRISEKIKNEEEVVLWNIAGIVPDTNNEYEEL